MIVALLNGELVKDSRRAIDVEDRGLAYGDGLFETMLLARGAVRFFDDHFQRLSQSCARLGIDVPTERELLDDIARASEHGDRGVIKMILTRGAGGRGYAAPSATKPTRVVMLYPPFDRSSDESNTLRWCSTRLARNVQLAGMKHLNRLEYVLARREWNDPSIADGLLLDTEGELVESTISNVFAVIHGVLTTPDLRFCGVRGVMRQRVLQLARQLGIESEERSMYPDDVADAEELFLTNAIRGIRPVRGLDEQSWEVGPITHRLMKALEVE